jgi:hypothetical protein
MLTLLVQRTPNKSNVTYSDRFHFLFTHSVILSSRVDRGARYSFAKTSQDDWLAVNLMACPLFLASPGFVLFIVSLYPLHTTFLFLVLS